MCKKCNKKYDLQIVIRNAIEFQLAVSEPVAVYKLPDGSYSYATYNYAIANELNIILIL